MKNIIGLLLCCLAFTACSSDDEASTAISESDFVGEWVYDHPEEGYWETQKFTSTGAFYFSSDRYAGWKIDNRMVPGQYRKSGDRTLIINSMMGDLPVANTLTVTALTPYSYSAQYSEADTPEKIFTYARLLTTLTVRPGERVTPSYDTLAPRHSGAFRSHNSAIATADTGSGEITGVRSGFTYVDIATPEGTAVVGVAVFDPDNMFKDYSMYIGKTVSQVVESEGTDYFYRDDSNGLRYISDDYLTDTITYITGVQDRQHVEYVQLAFGDRVSSGDIERYLAARYEPLPGEREEMVYVTGATAQGLATVVRYDARSRTAAFFAVKPIDLWRDECDLFGLSDSDVNKQMKEQGGKYLFSDYSYSRDGSDYYDFPGSAVASLIGFVFNGEGKMCEYWVYLNDDYASHMAEVTKWLNAIYVYAPKESTTSQTIYYDASRRVRVVLDASGYVSYTDSAQKPFTPAAAAAKSAPRRPASAH